MMAEESSVSMDQSGDDGNQEVVTLGEILQSEQELLEDANAVLGAIDDKKCTYSEGYMKRQALYSCLTCIPEAKTDSAKGAGVCLACCYNCHEGHELVELYTKRNFRCDCGNGRFPNRNCNLENTKVEFNESNQYNQNFKGLYCTCNRPYPDPEDSVEDIMIQCIICEDWYHSRHLGIPIPPHNSYSEMTCESCISKHPFLLHYDGLTINKVIPEEQTDTNPAEPKVDVENSLSQLKEDESQAQDSKETPVAAALDTPANGDCIVDNETCKKPVTKSEKVSSKFWADVEWRKQLCGCAECVKMYEEENVMFLLDPQDTVQVYEEKGKAKAREFEAKQEEDSMKFLNSLDRVPLMEAIAGYNNMKESLIEYLKKFAENKKVVREEDIREFFSNYDSKKKQKCEMPHYCR